MYPRTIWFETAADLAAAAAGSLDVMRAVDARMASQQSAQGYCVHCEDTVQLKVDGGALFGDDVNLREGLVCQRCGLNSRSRLLYMEARRCFGQEARMALLEAFSPLAGYAGAAWREMRLSEFHSPGTRSGSVHTFECPDGVLRNAVHQDMQALSYADSTLDGIMHNDVLEHVPDPLAGMRECHRVLVPGGTALFTMPWFPWLEETLVRGRLDEEGRLEEHLPTELHGDGLRPEGIYTFQNFGADFGGLLARAGFRVYAFGVCYDPYAGFTTNNYRYGDEFLMLPVVVRAVRERIEMVNPSPESIME